VGRLTLNAAAGATGELPRRRRRAADDRRDLLERHREHVVQHEHEPLSGRERIEHDQQRQANRVGQQQLLIRIGLPDTAHDRIGHVHAHRHLTPRSPRLERVQTNACNHNRQPTIEILDRGSIRATEPKPRLLHRIVRLVQRAEYPIGGRTQPRAALLEAPRQQVALTHSVLIHPLITKTTESRQT
jgi:hypothetical protein